MSGLARAKDLCLLAFLGVFCFILLSAASAAEERVTITSDSLEYSSATRKYVAKGSVVVTRDGETVKADEITYYEDTSVADAQGNVHYDAEGVSIDASGGEINLETKTGVLYDAELFYKKTNYHLSGKVLEKRGESYYYSPDASFTTCDAPVPAWCFRAKDVNARMGKKLTARDATFSVKNVPVFYTPYIWTSLLTERQTGFLSPVIGSSKARGAEVSVPFFWAISESMDATAVVDAYTKGGIGTGLEYRLVAPGGIKSNWWAYHIDDSVTDKSFWEVNALHENRHDEKTGGYLSIDYVNEKDFYREFGSRFQDRSKRFLQSTGELNVPFSNSRLYVLSQYWVDLKNETANVAQRLPELGYVLNYTPAGNFLFSASLDAADFWREDGLSAARVDVYPRVLHSVGTDYVLSQAAGLRGTAYSYYGGDSTDPDGSSERTAFEYQATAHTRLYKQYGSLTHVIEPSIGYHFISSSKNDLPVFDSAELFGKTSLIELGLLNRGIVNGSERFAVRLTQPIDTNNGDRPFLPISLDAATDFPLPLVLGATYDVNTGTIETVTSDVGLPFPGASIFIGERYSREEDVMMYTASAAFNPAKWIELSGQVWYDAKGQGLRDLTLTARYVRQCWGLKFQATKKPGDFSMKVMIELAGLNSKPAQSESPSPLSSF